MTKSDHDKLNEFKGEEKRRQHTIIPLSDHIKQIEENLYVNLQVIR